LIVETQPNLDEQLDRLAWRLPHWMGRALDWLRKPGSAYVRIPVAIVLVLGGFLSFLPVLGIWMLPLGLILIAQDLPFLRTPMARLLAWIDRKWPPKAEIVTGRSK
jgi:hypothetical protein